MSGGNPIATPAVSTATTSQFQRTTSSADVDRHDPSRSPDNLSAVQVTASDDAGVTCAHGMKMGVDTASAADGNVGETAAAPRRVPGLPRSQKKWLKRQTDRGQRTAKRSKRQSDAPSCDEASGPGSAILEHAGPGPLTTDSCSTTKDRELLVLPKNCLSATSPAVPSSTSSRTAGDNLRSRPGEVLGEAEDPPGIGRIEAKRRRTEEEARRLESAFRDPGSLKVVINCSFCGEMNFKELLSLRKQIELSYNVFKQSKYPIQLHLTSFCPKTNPLAAAWNVVRSDLKAVVSQEQQVLEENNSTKTTTMISCCSSSTSTKSTSSGSVISSPYGAEQALEAKNKADPEDGSSLDALLEQRLQDVLGSFASAKLQGQRRLLTLVRSLALEKWKIHIHERPYWEVFASSSSVSSSSGEGRRPQLIVLSPDAEAPLLDLQELVNHVRSGVSLPPSPGATCSPTKNDKNHIPAHDPRLTAADKQTVQQVVGMDAQDGPPTSPSGSNKKTDNSSSTKTSASSKSFGNLFFVIGGSVDRTVQRGQTLEQSQKPDVRCRVQRCVRLPIREFAAKGSAKILNIDTVIQMVSMKAWKETERERHHQGWLDYNISAGSSTSSSSHDPHPQITRPPVMKRCTTNSIEKENPAAGAASISAKAGVVLQVVVENKIRQEHEDEKKLEQGSPGARSTSLDDHASSEAVGQAVVPAAFIVSTQHQHSTHEHSTASSTTGEGQGVEENRLSVESMASSTEKSKKGTRKSEITFSEETASEWRQIFRHCLSSRFTSVNNVT
ncbi:unnamed protein product [Amoebophrya sp. A25]|nr:unnamed protein product [Amoebophrya sp. A25]|eukprot:GSA25T00005640001.1